MTSETKVLRLVIASGLVAWRAPITGSVTLVLVLRILTNLRVSGVVAAELRHKQWSKILSLAPMHV